MIFAFAAAAALLTAVPGTSATECNLRNVAACKTCGDLAWTDEFRLALARFIRLAPGYTIDRQSARVWLSEVPLIGSGDPEPIQRISQTTWLLKTTLDCMGGRGAVAITSDGRIRAIALLTDPWSDEEKRWVLDIFAPKGPENRRWIDMMRQWGREEAARRKRPECRGSLDPPPPFNPHPFPPKGLSATHIHWVHGP